MSSPGRKRQRTDDYSSKISDSVAAEVRSRRSAFLSSLNRNVSPPPGRDSPWTATTARREAETGSNVVPATRASKAQSQFSLPEHLGANSIDSVHSRCRIVESPFKLTCIRDLPAEANIDTVAVKDILGDVMLKEVWLFDYLYDVDWVMQQFDPDIQPVLTVVLVHGSWRREDPNKVHIDVSQLTTYMMLTMTARACLIADQPQEASKRYPNVRVVTAHMPDMYGCHHSKCMVLFRRDDLAQVIIHTANMIEQDWRNLTQGAWLSPLLPRLAHHAPKGLSGTLPAIGTGSRFKQDFMAYLRHYGGNRTTRLISQLEQYDFAAIRAALVAHVPAKFNNEGENPSAHLWGWPALKRALGSLPLSSPSGNNYDAQTAAHIVCQVSSIASLGDKWIRETLFSTLGHTSVPVPTAARNVKATPLSQARTKFSIVFPTPLEIRTCLDGYPAGNSIHFKLQSASQRKQFEFMRPHLCHWNAESSPAPTPQSNHSGTMRGRALRGPAAPHIKTFIRFSETSAHKEIDWALLTSANLSTQAWGTGAQSGSGDVRVSSYELGVLVWPDLFVHGEDHGDGDNGAGKKGMNVKAKMIPTFGSDTPTDAQIHEVVTSAFAATTIMTTTPMTSRRPPTMMADGLNPPDNGGQCKRWEDGKGEDEDEVVIIGLRMPYDLPLAPYTGQDEAWSARSTYPEPDVFGQAWNI